MKGKLSQNHNLDKSSEHTYKQMEKNDLNIGEKGIQIKQPIDLMSSITHIDGHHTNINREIQKHVNYKDDARSELIKTSSTKKKNKNGKTLVNKP